MTSTRKFWLKKMCAENVRTRAVVTFTPFWPNWRQAGGSLEAGWRQAGGRLEAGWRQAGGRLEHTWVTTRFWLLFRRLFKVGPAWAGGQAYPSMVGSMVAAWLEAAGGRLEAGWKHHLRIYSFLANRAAWELSCSLAGWRHAEGRLEASLKDLQLFGQPLSCSLAGGRVAACGHAGGRLEAGRRQAGSIT